ncbi:NYN domain-containing protein [Caballeronia sp. GAWG2-1]|uniref:NYN domain-containing protein n=1 Tax=Caballeronia sp. GAWG2-1 TaxID=2921744 RepID=UPI00254027E1|nr:NYN domain-containing protein [Caballeronia sp. GAWG2-1]
MQRTNVYVDGAYFLNGTRGLGMSMDIDLAGLIRKLMPEAEFNRMYYFSSIAPEHIYPARRAHELKIAARFKEQGFEPVSYPAEIKAHIYIDRGIEAGFSTRMIREAARNDYDRALLVTRRPDLVEPIQAVRGMGKAVDLRFYEYTTDPVNRLIAHCDTYAELTVPDVAGFIRRGGKPVYSYR